MDNELIARTVHQMLGDSAKLLDAAARKDMIDHVQIERCDIIIIKTRMDRLLAHLDAQRTRLEAAE